MGAVRTVVAGMVDEQATVEPQAPPSSGNLAPVALGLGVAGMATALVPFYGVFTGLPLSVVALVLGLAARARPWESRGQAIGGIATGAVGLLAALVWVGSFVGGLLGAGSVSSQTSVSVGAGTATADRPVSPPAGEEIPETEGPTEVTPGDPGPELAAGLSGEAELAVGERTRTLALDDCALAAGTTPGILVRGHGPEGRLVASRSGGMPQLVLDLDIDEELSSTYTGEVTSTGVTSRGDGGLAGDRHHFELDGELRDLYRSQTVDIHLTVTCTSDA